MEKAKEEFRTISAAATLAPKDTTSIGHSDPIWSEFAAAMDNDLQTPTALRLLAKMSEEMIDANKRKELGRTYWDIIETLGFNLF